MIITQKHHDVKHSVVKIILRCRMQGRIDVKIHYIIVELVCEQIKLRMPLFDIIGGHIIYSTL